MHVLLHCAYSSASSTCHCCRIQAAQAAATPATDPLESEPHLREDPPPLPPLPPEEEAPPPPPSAEPPFAPAPPPLPTAQTFQPAYGTLHPSQQCTWQQPGQFGRQQCTTQHTVSGSGHPPHCSASSGPQGSGSGSSFNNTRVKIEDGTAANVETASAAVKTEAGTTGRPAQMSSGQQQARQSSGAIQFGFGGSGKPGGKVSMHCCMTIMIWQMQGSKTDLVVAMV